MNVAHRNDTMSVKNVETELQTTRDIKTKVSFKIKSAAPTLVNDAFKRDANAMARVISLRERFHALIDALE